MLRKLAGFPRQNPVARALREIGRIERSLFMLDWFDDPEQRRRTGSILNEGEARNALARAIFFNRLGELRDRTFENQRHCASGLTLLTAAVTLWNGAKQFAGAFEMRLAGGTGEQAVPADAVETLWQDVEQEAADELVGGRARDGGAPRPLPPGGARS